MRSYQTARSVLLGARDIIHVLIANDDIHVATFSIFFNLRPNRAVSSLSRCVKDNQVATTPIMSKIEAV